MKFPMEVYNPQGAHKVVFGPEEHAAAKAEGWTDERPREESTESYEAMVALLEQREPRSPLYLGVYDPDPALAEQPSNLSKPKRRGRPPKVQSIGEVA